MEKLSYGWKPKLVKMTDHCVEDTARMIELGFCIDEDLGKFTFSV